MSAMVTLEYPLPILRADVWMAARLGLRGTLVLTAGWTTLSMLGGYQGAQAGAYAFVCAFAALWLPRLGLVLLGLLLATGIAAASLGQGALVLAFAALCVALYCRRKDLTRIAPDGSYGDRVPGHLMDGSHVVALAVLTPVLLASGMGTLPVLLVAAMAADRFVWAVPAFVASAVLLLPKVVDTRAATAVGAGVLLPDALPQRLQAVHASHDLVDMTQALVHAQWALLPNGLLAAGTVALTLVGRHPVVLVEALGWTMAVLVALWLRGAVLRPGGRALGLRRLVGAQVVALVVAGGLVALTELVLAPALAGAPARHGFTVLVVQDLWHSALVVVALLVVELALLATRPRPTRVAS
jgi:hypothetical protein